MGSGGARGKSRVSRKGVLRFLFPPSLGRAKAAARAELLAPALTLALGEPVEIVMATDYLDLEERALSGSAEIVWAPAGVCARIAHTARAIFKVVRGGSSTYRGALVARGGAGISLANGMRLRAAWVDRRSVGGYLLIRAHLLARGSNPDVVFAEQRFVGSHPAVIEAILHGEADVGAVTVPSPDEKSAREAIASYVGPSANRLELVTITDEAPTDAMVLTRALTTARAAEISASLVPSGLDLRPLPALLGVMQADTLIRARPGEYDAVLRLVRESLGGF
jgi:ABC-type phosphate/phosphonate transport system substrate-binding protein